jgi:hypothetical protein
MIKKIIVLVLSIMTLIACKDDKKENTNLHLSGNIKGLSQGKLYIQQLKDSTLAVIDSITIKGDSKFEIDLKIDGPEMLYIFLDRGQTNSIDNNLQFFAEPGNMTIETTLDAFFANAKVTGSKNHDLYVEFNEMKSKFNDKKMALIEQEFKNISENKSKNNDSIIDANNKLIRKRYLYTANFASIHGDKEIAPYLALSEIADINIRYLDTIESKMKPEVAKSKYGKMLKSYIEQRKKTETK